MSKVNMLLILAFVALGTSLDCKAQSPQGTLLVRGLPLTQDVEIQAVYGNNTQGM